MKRVERFDIFELLLKGEEPADSRVVVDCSAVFKNGDQRFTINGFYNGNREYKIRFMPQEQGIWRYEIGSSFADPDDSYGEFECVENTGRNHGPVITNGTHFQYADGTKYIPFGTTAYAWTHQPVDLRERTKKTLSESPFNKIRMCLFPKSMVYNNNDPERYPFTKNAEGKWDVHNPDLGYWTDLENQLKDLMDMGIEADLILFHPYDKGRWGFDELSREDNLAYLKYCVRRLSAFRNIWWSLANEYDMVFRKTEEEWESFGNFIRQEDPYQHLLSIHNWIQLYDFKRPWITHCSIQSALVHKTEDWKNEFQKPVVIDECEYEGNIEESWGHLSAFEMAHRFWTVTLKGGYCTHGETYHREDEVLWWSKGGDLHGESVKRIRFLQEIVYGLEGEIQPVQGKFRINPNDLQMTADNPSVQHNPYLKQILSMNPVDRALLSMNNATYAGRHGDDCFIHYFGKSCQSLFTLDLPEAGDYAIDLIDIWEMTREMIIPKASGKTKLRLPGKEGTAVIATRI